MITDGYKLGGHLVKWALKKKDGRCIEHSCDIHNTITKSCLNNMFEFNGPGSSVGGSEADYLAVNFWVSSQSLNSSRYGVFNFSALGDGVGITDVNDINLKHKIGDYTSTKKTGRGWCGSTAIIADNIQKLRIGHTHNITDNFTIKEIGWFNRIYPNGEYSLSARVQLDEFVDVEIGDVFYTVYELVVQLAMPHEVTLPYLGKAIATGRVNGRIEGSNFPIINTNGYGYSLYGSPYSDMQAFFPAYTLGSTTSQFYNMVKYTSSDTDAASNPASQIYFTECSKSNIVLEPYTLNTFFRDFNFEIPALYTTVYSFLFNNTVYRLGEYDENDNFVPNPYDGMKALKITIRQRIGTDLLTPSA